MTEASYCRLIVTGPAQSRRRFELENGTPIQLSRLCSVEQVGRDQADVNCSAWGCDSEPEQFSKEKHADSTHFFFSVIGGEPFTWMQRASEFYPDLAFTLTAVRPALKHVYERSAAEGVVASSCFTTVPRGRRTTSPRSRHPSASTPMPFREIKNQFEESCQRSGRVASTAFKQRVIELLSKLSFRDTFPGLIMGMGAWTFRGDEHCIDIVWDDGTVTQETWVEAMDSVRCSKVFRLAPKPGFRDIDHLREIGRILDYINDDVAEAVSCIPTIDVNKEELNAYITANSRPPRKGLPRGRKADRQDGSRPLARSVLQTALR